jgi:short-subunit dehydrogenase
MPYAVITGATQGIGKAVAARLLAEGFAVAVAARTQTDLESTKADWESMYPSARILTFQADLGNKNEAKAFAAYVLNSFPEIDVLVNNAGLFFPGKLAEEPEGHLEQLMEVNMYSAYHLTRAILPSMKARKTGHIFNMCSIASLQAYENGGAYSITKYALQGFSENLRHELMEWGIKVTALMPGATWSRSWASTGLPEARFMKPEDIASMIWAAYTLSESADVETIIIRPILGDL